MPEAVLACMESWKRVLPEYEIVCWNRERFDLNSVGFVKEACEARKWAFASDYIRLHALYERGGLYLDSDVWVRKTFDGFLDNRLFSAIEYHPQAFDKARDLVDSRGVSKKSGTHIPGLGIQAAIIGSRKGHPFLAECMDFYRNIHFRLDESTYFDKIIAPAVLAMTAERRGFRYANEDQRLRGDIRLYDSNVFASNWRLSSETSVAVHLCTGSWRDRKGIRGVLWRARSKLGSLRRRLVGFRDSPF